MTLIKLRKYALYLYINRLGIRALYRAILRQDREEQD
jgi:hypothetical protein